jgi:hypothetical protein
VQWCIGHLTDHDFIAFFKRAQVLFLDKKFHSWLYYTKWRISLIHWRKLVFESTEYSSCLFHFSDGSGIIAGWAEARRFFCPQREHC